MDKTTHTTTRRLSADTGGGHHTRRKDGDRSWSHDSGSSQDMCTHHTALRPPFLDSRTHRYSAGRQAGSSRCPDTGSGFLDTVRPPGVCWSVAQSRSLGVLDFLHSSTRFLDTLSESMKVNNFAPVFSFFNKLVV